MGNVTSSLSNLFLLNYAPMWQIICRLYARWIEFSVPVSSPVNITNSSQGSLLFPDGTRCALCISSNLWGLLFSKKWECSNILHIFLFLCQYISIPWQSKKKSDLHLYSVHTEWEKKEILYYYVFLILKSFFHLPRAFWNLRVITAWGLLNPLLARPQPSGCLSWLISEEHYEVCVMTHLCLWNI